jgi:uncharacterized cupredoxin-like copper-binding protein
LAYWQAFTTEAEVRRYLRVYPNHNRWPRRLTIHMKGDPTMRMKLRALMLAASVGLTTACGGTVSTADSGPSSAIPAGASTAGGQQLTVPVGNAMHFAPSSLMVRAGQPIELTLRNGGSIPHDFTLVDGASGPVKIEAQGGQTARGTFAIDSPGTYAFVCSVPGHAAAGMQGTITAQ